MGEYESFRFGAEISADHHDLGISDQELIDMSEEDASQSVDDLFLLVDTALTDVLAADVKEASLTAKNERAILQSFAKRRTKANG